MQAKIKLPDELTSVLKTAIINAAEEIAKSSKESNDKWPQYMDKGTAAKYMGMSYGTFSKWIKAVDLPYKHVSGSYRFNRTELDKFMTSK